jgi:ABC-type sugar transport system permease subunit
MGNRIVLPWLGQWRIRGPKSRIEKKLLITVLGFVALLGLSFFEWIYVAANTYSRNRRISFNLFSYQYNSIIIRNFFSFEEYDLVNTGGYGVLVSLAYILLAFLILSFVVLALSVFLQLRKKEKPGTVLAYMGFGLAAAVMTALLLAVWQADSRIRDITNNTIGMPLNVSYFAIAAAAVIIISILCLISTLPMTLTTKDKLKGLVFVSPFIAGVILFFAYPIFLSLRLSFGHLDNIIGLKISNAKPFYENYLRAFVLDTEFLPLFLQIIRDTMVHFPLTIVLSLVIAILINRDIRGKGLFRVIFFIPFLLGTGELMRQLLNQGVDMKVLSITDGRIIPYNILSYFGGTVVDAVQTILGLIVKVLWGCGVQILLFLTALQSISPALYEAAKIDGATEWEVFWKVTVPMVSPMLLLNIIYTIVDSFTNVTNPMLDYINTFGFRRAEFTYAAAMGWIYFAFVGLLVAIVFAGMKGYMHTNEVEEVRKRVRKNRKIFTIESKKKRAY